MPNLTGKSPITTANHKHGTVDFLRSGAYVNLNDIASQFGKRIDAWTRLKGTQELFESFKKEPCYRGYEPIYAAKGGKELPTHLWDVVKNDGTARASGKGTWAHPDIAIAFAMWCDPGFHLWVARQVRHLLTYGEVNLHVTEWTSEQLEKGREYNREDMKDLYR